MNHAKNEHIGDSVRDMKREEESLMKLSSDTGDGDEDTVRLVDLHRVYSFVPYAKLSWNPLRLLSLILIFCWGSFMVYIWMWKEISEGDNDTYWMYLTNWSWTLQAIFWTAKFLGYLESLITYRHKEVPNYIIYHVYYWLFWPTLMVNTAVTWVVLLVLYDSPGLLTNYFASMGPGIVLVGNFVFHVATYILMVSELILTYEDHMYMLRRSLSSLIRFFFVQLTFANVYVIMYLALHNIHDVYGLEDFSYWFILSMFEFVMFVPNVILMLRFSPITYVYRTGFTLTKAMREKYRQYETRLLP